jgi:hypothetical protein
MALFVNYLDGPLVVFARSVPNEMLRLLQEPRTLNIENLSQMTEKMLSCLITGNGIRCPPSKFSEFSYLK